MSAACYRFPMIRRMLLLFAAGTLFAQSTPPPAAFDLVVYGGTGGGVIAAVSGARMGLKVALLEPRRHIGGMVSGGLSRTDVGRREVIGGYALEFYFRAGKEKEQAASHSGYGSRLRPWSQFRALLISKALTSPAPRGPLSTIKWAWGQ